MFKDFKKSLISRLSYNKIVLGQIRAPLQKLKYSFEIISSQGASIEFLFTFLTYLGLDQTCDTNIAHMQVIFLHTKDLCFQSKMSQIVTEGWTLDKLKHIPDFNHYYFFIILNPIVHDQGGHILPTETIYQNNSLLKVYKTVCNLKTFTNIIYTVKKLQYSAFWCYIVYLSILQNIIHT